MAIRESGLIKNAILHNKPVINGKKSDLYFFDFIVVIDAIAKGRDKAIWSQPVKLNNLKVEVLTKHKDNNVEISR